MIRLLPLIVLAAGCGGEPAAGTQIGFEEGGLCQELSSEVVSDRAAVPADFDASVDVLVSEMVGSFSGPLLDDQEQPTNSSVGMVVSERAGDVVLTRYEIRDDAGGIEPDLGAACPAQLTIPMSVILDAPGGSWESPVDVRVGASGGSGGGARVGPADEVLFPAPLTLDPEQLDDLYIRVDLSHAVDGAWWLTVGWYGETVGEGEDGTASITMESLMMARLLLD